MDDARSIELHVKSIEALQDRWLDGLPFGGLFVAGSVPLGAGDLVVLRISLAHPAADTKETTVFLRGQVTWRRAPRASLAPNVVSLPPGIGIAFSSDSAAQSAFLQELIRGKLPERRGALRIPSDLTLPFTVPSGTKQTQHEARVLDVGLRGARIELKNALATPKVSTAVAITWEGLALEGHVVWRLAKGQAGVSLNLQDTAHRVAWAKLFTKAQQQLDYRRVFVDRSVAEE